MKRIAFATFDELPELEPDDYAVVQQLNSNKLKTDILLWDRNHVNWSDYQAVVIRSCWNYHLFPNEFLQWIDKLTDHGVTVYNNPEIIRWNLYKTYLRDLQEQGIAIIPTRWFSKGESVNIKKVLEDENWNDAVIKPVVSLGSYKTWRYSNLSDSENQAEFDQLIKSNEMMIQEFQDSILSEGEYSFIFLNGRFRFAIVKKPVANEFRVQEEYGGSKDWIEVPESLIKQAENVIDKIDADLLYARVDGVLKNGQLTLMELELIDPSLYLNLHPQGINYFAEAIQERLSI
ncbi:MAG: hypothetical protein KDD94_08495 [Calditrichaeota bacterium]|nr:hypothetical protein [Calditrichota bacterium]